MLVCFEMRTIDVQQAQLFSCKKKHMLAIAQIQQQHRCSPTLDVPLYAVRSQTTEAMACLYFLSVSHHNEGELLKRVLIAAGAILAHSRAASDIREQLSRDGCRPVEVALELLFSPFMAALPLSLQGWLSVVSVPFNQTLILSTLYVVGSLFTSICAEEIQ